LSVLGAPAQRGIADAIDDGAVYASTSLLYEDGRSKGDYNWVEGKWYDYESAWHTAQVIYGLVEAYKSTQNPQYLAAAKRAGQWWLSLEIKDHPTMNGMLNAQHGDKLGTLINFTTVTDGTNGIFELYRTLKEHNDPTANDYLQVCIKAADWMIANMYIPEEGLFYNIVDAETGEVWKDKSPHHPGVQNPTITQVARPNNEGYFFKDLFVHSGEEKYKNVFLNLCNSLVRRQGPEGLWMDFEPNDRENRGGKIHPRFNVWNAESLVEAYVLTNEEKYLEAAMRTGRKMADLQRKDGTIYYYHYLDGKYREGSLTGSAVSFSGILWLRLKEIKKTSEFDKHIDRSLNWVLNNRFPIDHPDENLAGAFLETRTRSKNGTYAIFVRDIATAFGLRFLSLYQRQM